MVRNLNKNIEIVLVEALGAGNIGSVARVMKNTGFSNLKLVDPVEYRNDEGWRMACKAKDVLDRAAIFPTLGGALRGSKVVVGTTRRKGKLRVPIFTLDEALPKIITLAKKNRVSILFGREDKGLKNEELDLSDMLVEIPTHRGCPSLNLAQAVLLVCHALFMAENPVEPALEAAEREDVEKLYEHLERAMRALGYGDKVEGEFLLGSIMRNFRRLFGRTSLIDKEVRMLRGILGRVEERRR